MKWLVIITTVLLFSCASDDEIPQECIPVEEFTNILYGMEIIDAIQIQNMRGETQKDSTTFAQYKFLFDSLNISKEKFDLSFAYYQTNPDLMMEMTDTLVARISRNEEKVSKELRDLRWRSNKKGD